MSAHRIITKISSAYLFAKLAQITAAFRSREANRNEKLLTVTIAMALCLSLKDGYDLQQENQS